MRLQLSNVRGLRDLNLVICRLAAIACVNVMKSLIGRGKAFASFLAAPGSLFCEELISGLVKEMESFPVDRPSIDHRADRDEVSRGARHADLALMRMTLGAHLF
jgi:hypothetical protein